MTLKVHHLHCSQSERVLFLCEELGIEYDLKVYDRQPLIAPPDLKALHFMQSAPVIQDGDLTLGESAACVEYICRRHGGNRLWLPPDHPDWTEFLFWFHWSNGSFQSTIGRQMMARAYKISEDQPGQKLFTQRFEGSLKALDERLAKNEWLAGKEFTAADVMLMFSLTTMRYWYPYKIEQPNIRSYIKRVSERESYKRALKKGDPDMTLALGQDPPKAQM